MKIWSLQHLRFWNCEDVGRRAWPATVHGFARSWTQLSDQTTTTRLIVDGSSRLTEARRGCFMEESRPDAPWSGHEPGGSGQMALLQEPSPSVPWPGFGLGLSYRRCFPWEVQLGAQFNLKFLPWPFGLSATPVPAPDLTGWRAEVFSPGEIRGRDVWG